VFVIVTLRSLDSISYHYRAFIPVYCDFMVLWSLPGSSFLWTLLPALTLACMKLMILDCPVTSTVYVCLSLLHCMFK